MSDDEMLLRMECTLDEIEAMRRAGPPRRYEYLDAEQPLVMLIRHLASRADRNFIQLEKNGVTITLSHTLAPS